MYVQCNVDCLTLSLRRLTTQHTRGADAPAVKSRRAVKTLEIHQQNAIFKCCLLMEVKRLQIAER